MLQQQTSLSEPEKQENAWTEHQVGTDSEALRDDSKALGSDLEELVTISGL